MDSFASSYQTGIDQRRSANIAVRVDAVWSGSRLGSIWPVYRKISLHFHFQFRLCNIGPNCQFTRRKVTRFRDGCCAAVAATRLLYNEDLPHRGKSPAWWLSTSFLNGVKLLQTRVAYHPAWYLNQCIIVFYMVIHDNVQIVDLTAVVFAMFPIAKRMRKKKKLLRRVRMARVSVRRCSGYLVMTAKTVVLLCIIKNQCGSLSKRLSYVFVLRR